MNNDSTRRSVIKGVFASALALAATPLWAEIEDEQQKADHFWSIYLSGNDPGLRRHPNREAEAALQAIAAPLYKSSTRSNLKWRIGLLSVDPQDINAYAMGGGVIMINDALLKVCTGETDLATVIGHEIGHIEHRHSIKRMYSTEVLSRYGINPNMDRAVVAEALRRKLHLLVADKVIYQSYKRLWEYEADAFAVRVLNNSGYDPALGPVFFETLMNLYPGRDDIATCLVNTHPENHDRIARMRALAKGYARGASRRDSAHYRKLIELTA